MCNYVNKDAVIKILEDCHLDKDLFEKDVFDKINALETISEKEIIRKPMERIIERLKEKANQCWLVLAERNGYERAICIVKEEGGIE